MNESLLCFVLSSVTIIQIMQMKIFRIFSNVNHYLSIIGRNKFHFLSFSASFFFLLCRKKKIFSSYVTNEENLSSIDITRHMYMATINRSQCRCRCRCPNSFFSLLFNITRLNTLIDRPICIPNYVYRRSKHNY